MHAWYLFTGVDTVFKMRLHGIFLSFKTKLEPFIFENTWSQHTWCNLSAILNDKEVEVTILVHFTSFVLFLWELSCEKTGLGGIYEQ